MGLPAEPRSRPWRSPSDAGSFAALGVTRAEVAVATDWRRHLRRHKREVIIGAAVAGFVIGGGIAAMGGLFGRRG